MILEVAAPTFNPNANIVDDETPNHDVEQFFDMLKAIEEPLYDVCKLHSFISNIKVIEQ